MSTRVAPGRTERFGSIYRKDVLSAILQGSEDLEHWGIVQCHGGLAAAALNELSLRSILKSIR
jgi:multiple sugar transport system substrate-binding protein